MMGIWDPKKGYGVFHKWGTKKDVESVLKTMRKSMAKCGLEDTFVTYKIGEFSLQQFHEFLDLPYAWTDFNKKRST